MSNLQTIPISIDVGSGEKAYWNFECADILGTSESVQTSPAPTSSVQIASTRATITSAIIAPIIVSGTMIQVQIDGTKLTVGQRYFWIVNFNVTSIKQLQGYVIVNCVL